MATSDESAPQMDVYQQLRAATPQQRREIVLGLIEVHPKKKLELPWRADGARANLQGICLQGVDLQGADLRGANLQDADLRDADLRGANLRQANLQDAGLSDANLQGAILASANLQGAGLIHADLQGARLWDASLQGAILTDADLQGATLQMVNLHGAALWTANLQGAHLERAKLEGVDFSDATITHVHLADAWLDRTRMRKDQLGGAIGEELAGDNTAAKRGYLGLKQNFLELGDYDAASWAYRKERRMEKWEALTKAREARTQRKWRPAIAGYSKVAADWVVELLCDYGESVWRVLAWMGGLLALSTIVLFILGTLALEWPQDSRALAAYCSHPDPLSRTAYMLGQSFVYVLDTFTTANNSELKPASIWVQVPSGIMAIVGIFLAGLLGFVAGNRIRRS